MIRTKCFQCLDLEAAPFQVCVFVRMSVCMVDCGLGEEQRSSLLDISDDEAQCTCAFDCSLECVSAGAPVDHCFRMQDRSGNPDG